MSPRRAVPIAAVLIALVFTAPADAKGLARVLSCGADGCADVTAAATRGARCDACNFERLLGGAAGTRSPVKSAPFHRIKLGFGEPGGEVRHDVTLIVAPGSGVAARPSQVAGEWDWFDLGAEDLAFVRRLVGSRRPFAAAQLPLPDPPPSSIAVPIPPDDSSAPALALGGGAAAATALAAAALLAVRRRRAA